MCVHAALATWGVLANSVTFDENFHLPAGVAMVARGYVAASVAQPPLVKAISALPALAAGARVPSDSVTRIPDEARVGEAFMRANHDRYQRVYVAGRLAVVAISLLLGWLVWRFADRLYGRRAGILALLVYAILPDSLAHAGVVGMDVATGLGFLGTIYAFWRFAESGRWRHWAWTAFALGASALTRFSAIQLGPILIGLAAAAALSGRLASPGRTWLGLALLPLTTLLALHLGYLGQTTFEPISSYAFHSPTFRTLQASHPGLRPPLPDAYVGGLDYLLSLAESNKPSYLLGELRTGPTWYYFPVALLVKWPLGLMGLLVARIVMLVRAGRTRWDVWHGCLLAVPVLVVLGSAMGSRLEFGVRYVFPILPLLCIWLGGIMAGGAPELTGGVPAARAHPRRRVAHGRPAAQVVAICLVGVLAVETITCAPWYLSFFNAVAGGPGGGDRVVNDSNVDWGQGLLALREELEKRGVRRVHLAYHGTTDPALYGIDYIPYLGGTPGAESDWLAVSSYFLVGLPAPMMTREGRTGFIQIDFRMLKDGTPVARPAGCMYLFRLPAR